MFTKSLIALSLLITASCAHTKDLEKTLKLSDNTPIDISKLNFVELQKMKSGESCMYNLLFFRVYGDSSVIEAAKNGGINNVQIIGEKGYWIFPLTKKCTIVYGDAPVLPLSTEHLDEGRLFTITPQTK